MENEINSLIVQDNISNEEIKNLIYTIRGKQVMLDSDVAMLYHYTTKNINKAVKRNIFTEQGISMLSGVLKNEIAVKVSISIIRAFVEMRKFISSNGQLFERLTNVEYKLLEHDKKFDKVFNQLQNEENIKQKIFFEGQIYDAYSLIIDIIKKANKKILIIDNYIDDSVLKMLTKKNKAVEVVLLTSDKSNIEKIDIQKFNKEYPILKVAKTNKFHDRFIVIDNKEMYHLGASIKDLGKKCFGINKIEDMKIIDKIINL